MNCQGANSYMDTSSVGQVLSPSFVPTQTQNMPNMQNMQSMQSSQGAMPYSGQMTIQQVLSPDFRLPQNTNWGDTDNDPQTMSNMPQTQAGPYTSDSQLSPITSSTQPPAMTLSSIQYLNGALQTQVGNKVQVQFLIGTNTFQDRIGTLLAVGADYIIINEIETDDILFCDFYTIKFVRVFR